MIDRRWIGETLPPAALTIERGRLQFFAKAIGEDRAVYRDLAAARAAGHPDLPAPPTFLFAAELDADAAFWLVARLGVPLARILHGEQRFTYRRLVHAGETVTVRTRVADIYARKDGALEFVVLESRVEDATGAPVASQRSVWVARHPDDAAIAAPAAAPAATTAGAASAGATAEAFARTPAVRQSAEVAGNAPVAGAGALPTDLALGAHLPSLALPPLTRHTLALFAGASGDHNPIHLDSDFARAVGHPDVFAQGMLGMAWLGRLVTRTLPQNRLRSLAARFTAVTHVGDAIACCGKVVDHFDDAGKPRARLALTAQTADGTVTVRGEAVVARA